MRVNNDFFYAVTCDYEEEKESVPSELSSKDDVEIEGQEEEEEEVGYKD